MKHGCQGNPTCMANWVSDFDDLWPIPFQNLLGPSRVSLVNDFRHESHGLTSGDNYNWKKKMSFSLYNFSLITSVFKLSDLYPCRKTIKQETFIVGRHHLKATMCILPICTQHCELIQRNAGRLFPPARSTFQVSLWSQNKSKLQSLIDIPPSRQSINGLYEEGSKGQKSRHWF